PQGFLFLCPLADFRTERTYSFKWPICPAYWSFDSSGTRRLSTEDAVKFGFPCMVRSTEVRANSWHDEVYAGIRQFHAAKGFDPDSQDVARHLGPSLYQLSNNAHIPFAHSESTAN
ncbi:hypothetical protein K438DRAFT_1632449, partial [Mycena galopus ATCC 62051]